MCKRCIAAALSLILFLTLVPAASVWAAGDDYPYKDMPYKRYSDQDFDPWKFYYRECTSFVAWRLNNDNGIEFDDFYGGVQWGNGREWGPAAKSLGIPVDDRPAPGAVYWQDANFHCSEFGHVGWVKEILDDGRVVIEHYAAGRYEEQTVPSTYASGYIHICDLDAAAPAKLHPAPVPTPESVLTEDKAEDKTEEEAATASVEQTPEKPAQSKPPLAAAQQVHFPKSGRSAEFADVAEDAWYREAVSGAVAYGLMEGSGAGVFRPEGEVTVTETVVLASRIHNIFTSAGWNFAAEEGERWYEPYFTYAVIAGIVGKDLDAGRAGRAATRAEFAEILAAALPERGLAAINEVPDGSIPDVPMNAPWAGAVYRLYRAGILAGGSDGVFSPDSPITRAETAAIVSRMADSDNRVVF
ncbi:MAG: S-layer homology domain-containing protein [Oscillospiraceae bacterium]|nr:S-layer homology domain-containing protein [Oscillospiraceae bacterium]